jgi:hypothetical protein
MNSKQTMTHVARATNRNKPGKKKRLCYTLQIVFLFSSRSTLELSSDFSLSEIIEDLFQILGYSTMTKITNRKGSSVCYGLIEVDRPFYVKHEKIRTARKGWELCYETCKVLVLSPWHAPVESNHISLIRFNKSVPRKQQ